MQFVMGIPFNGEPFDRLGDRDGPADRAKRASGERYLLLELADAACRGP